jgi:hypothetical protein
MKHLLILAVALMGLSFGQVRYNAGAISGVIRYTGTNATTYLGHLPANAMVTEIGLAQEAKFTNIFTTNLVQLGISNATGNLLPSTQVPFIGQFIWPTNGTNCFVVLNSKAATPINGYMTTTGPAFGTNGVLRVIIRYLQIP